MLRSLSPVDISKTLDSAAHETATRYGAWCVSQSDLRLLGSRTNLGGYTHDPTHVTRVHDGVHH